MFKMHPKYEEYVKIGSDRKLLYVQPLRALYDCVVSALLWKEMGFMINPYDSCIANKIIDRKQCTSACYVDDMKISQI